MSKRTPSGIIRTFTEQEAIDAAKAHRASGHTTGRPFFDGADWIVEVFG